MKTTFRVISAPIFVIGVALMLNACGQGTGTTPIQAAKPTATGLKLIECANSKLAPQAKTYTGAEAKVCRARDGKIVNETLPVLFGSVQREKRVGIFQKVVFKITQRNSEGRVVEASANEETAARDRAMLEGAITRFLQETCRPLAKRAFTKTEIEADVTFRGKRKDDTWAQPTASGTSSKKLETYSDEPFGSTKKTVSRTATKPDGTTLEPQGVVISPSEYHSVLNLDVIGEGPNRQMRIADEVDAVLSGSLAVPEKPLEKPTDEQIRFCNQVIVRVGESFGLTKGRDCESRQAAADKAKSSTAESAPGAKVEVFKPTQEELLEVVKPVCGSIESRS